MPDPDPRTPATPGPTEDGRGARLRAARVEKGISLRELARRLDVSPGHISQIERDIVAPSISLLYAIVTELGLSMDALFGVAGSTVRPGGAPSAGGGVPDEGVEQPRTPGESRYVQRFSDRQSIEIQSGVRWELLAPRGESGVDFREIVYAPGGGSTADGGFIRHGGHEFGLVLEGVLHVQIEFDKFVLGVGDSLGFDSARPHRFWNEGPGVVRAVWLSNVAPAGS